MTDDLAARQALCGQCGHARRTHEWWLYESRKVYPNWPDGGVWEIGPCWFGASPSEMKPCPCEQYEDSV